MIAFLARHISNYVIRTNLTLAQTVNIHRVAPRARLSNCTHICVLQRSSRKLQQPKEGCFVEYDREAGRTTEERKVSTYLRVQEGYSIVLVAGKSRRYKTLRRHTLLSHDRGGSLPTLNCNRRYCIIQHMSSIGQHKVQYIP